jgi:hypothetical protein
LARRQAGEGEEPITGFLQAVAIDAQMAAQLGLEPVSTDIRTSLCSARGNSAGKEFGEARDGVATFGGDRRFRAAETALSGVSGGKAAESQRLFRRRQETGIAQDCVVELAGLERTTVRLFGSSSTARIGLPAQLSRK